MMIVAQIVKFIDAETPIRFLIAETETGFTMLAALYYARLFGVEDRIESPLFETEEAFERGERVIEEALKSPHYRAYPERQGRLAAQFGFSDSGRFIGQMPATFRIERLRLRLAQLLERHGLSKLESILFNTHGESIGRGGHPLTFADRLRYAAPPTSRAEFERRGVRASEGGD
jgi:phosphoenolpyruvate carboxylase